MMVQSDRIEGQYADAKDLYQYLLDHNEVSYATYIDDVYKKVLLLSAASYFEKEISAILLSFASKVSKSDQRLVKLIDNKVIQRQYHTLFDWNRNNSNPFWSLFGEELKTAARGKIDKSDELKDAEHAFLKLGQQRNLLVHENFAEFTVNTMTVDEIYYTYKKACKFVEFIAEEFSN